MFRVLLVPDLVHTYHLFNDLSHHLLSTLSSVCSTTLWVGQVDKKASPQDLTNLFEEFGQIESINVSRASSLRLRVSLS